MDFPADPRPPSPILTPYSIESLGPVLNAASTSLRLATSGAWPSANLAFAYPFVLYAPATVYQLLWYVGTTSNGNVDVGIYDSQFNRILSSGSTAMSATVSVVQELNVTDTVLMPGEYFLAGACSSATGTIFRNSTTDEIMLSLVPVYEMASAFPLPAKLTAVVSTQTSVIIPAIGIQFVPTF